MTGRESISLTTTVNVLTYTSEMLELLLDWFLGQSWDHINKDGTFKAILFKLTLQYYKMMLELCQAGA